MEEGVAKREAQLQLGKLTWRRKSGDGGNEMDIEERKAGDKSGWPAFPVTKTTAIPPFTHPTEQTALLLLWAAIPGTLIYECEHGRHTHTHTHTHPLRNSPTGCGKNWLHRKIQQDELGACTCKLLVTCMAHVQQVDPECYEPLWQTQHEPLRIQKMKWDGNRFEKKNQNIFLFPRTELSSGSSSPPREGLCPQQLREWPEVPYSLLHRTHCPTVGHCRCGSFTSSLFEIKIYLPVAYLCQFVDPWSQEWTGVICIPNAHPTHLLGFGGEPAERTKN